MKTHTALIFVNGELKDQAAARALITPGSLLIAADGGARHLLRMGLTPQVLIGDLDSLSAEEVTQMEAAGTLVKRYPMDKDWTDLELAVRYAVTAGCQRICLVAALGGRLDQTLGNISLLSDPAYAALNLSLDDGLEEVTLVKDQCEIKGNHGDIVSLLPLDAEAEGVRTHGLRWALNDETLYRCQTRGISNEMLGSVAEVFVRRGALLCIHTRHHNHSEEQLEVDHE